MCKTNKDKIQSVLLSEIWFRNPLDGGQGDLTIVKKWPMNLERFSYIEFWKAVNLWQLNFYLLWIFLKKKNNKFTKQNVMEEITGVSKVSVDAQKEIPIKFIIYHLPMSSNLCRTIQSAVTHIQFP